MIEATSAAPGAKEESTVPHGRPRRTFRHLWRREATAGHRTCPPDRPVLDETFEVC
jgi:hypothetical protein